MALTAASVGLTPELWDSQFFTNYVRSNQFARYMGTDENSMIQLKENLTNKNGDRVNYALVNDLTGAGVTGNTQLENAEEALNSRSYEQVVALARNGVVVHDWDEQKSVIDLREAARAQLKSWILKKTRNDILTALGSINGVAFASASEAQRDAWLVDNHDRVLFGKLKSNSVSDDHSVATTTIDATDDVANYTNLTLAKRMAKVASPSIRPIMIEDGTEWYVLFLSSPAFRDMKNSLATVLSTAEVRGKANPLFLDGDLIYDGVIIREVPEMAVIADVGAGGTVDVSRNFLCGAQAIAFAWAQRTTTRTEIRDYGALHGVAMQEIRGIGKMQFGKGAADRDDLVDHGVFTWVTAGEPDA